MPARRGHGFTLAELLVVLVILSLSAAVVVSSGPRLLDAQQQRAVSRNLLVDIKHARQRAISHGQAVDYVIDVEARRLGQTVGRQIELPPDVFMRVEVAGEQVENRVAIIRFEPDGSSTGGSIELYRPSGEGYRLAIDWLTGRTTGERVQWRP